MLMEKRTLSHRIPILLTLLIVSLAAGCGGPQKDPTQSPTGEQKVTQDSPKLTPISEPTLWNSKEEVQSSCASTIQKVDQMREAIVSPIDQRTLENALVPYNEMMLELERAIGPAALIANVHPEKAVREAAEACELDIEKRISQLELDHELYAVLSSLDPSQLDKDAQRSLEHTLRDYQRAGVDKDESTRAKLADLKDKMAKTGQNFSSNLREDRRFVEIKDVSRLEGLPQDYIDAHPTDENGVIRISTDYPDFFPVYTYAHDADLRRDAFLAFHQRAYPQNEAILKELLKLRHEYAQTLGYSNWAEYNAADKMAKDAATIDAFIHQVAEIARPRMEADVQEMLAAKQADDPSATTIEAWDRLYYTEKIKNERYGVDAQQVRSYFDYTKVKTGVLDLNQKLFGVTFQKVDAPTWHPDVEAYDVIEDGKTIGRFYLDMFPREGKYGHAAMFPILSGVDGLQPPAASLVCNFPQPNNGEPALMEHGDVTTFLHEFGHLMHHILGGQNKSWNNLSGIACEWDFVEAPSQLLEEWAWDPSVLQTFAVHYETQEPIPASLIEKMRAGKEFGLGVWVMRQMFYAGLSYTYHSMDPTELNLLETAKSVNAEFAPYPYAEGDYVYCNFGHLEGYSSMYYTYMWSLALAKDLFTRFQSDGLLNTEISAAYREAVLAAGGAVDANEMVASFLGREYQFEAFKTWLEGHAD